MNDKYTEVLSQYELEVRNVRRGRGAWLCETGDGIKLLREYKGTVKRLEFEDQVLKEIHSLGNLPVDCYVRNREDSLLSTSEDGTRYILKDWYEDRECNIKDGAEIICAVGQIAKLHRALRQIEFKEEWNMGSILIQPPDIEMERHNQELKRARSFIRSKRKKSDFELCVIGNFGMFYEQAVSAAEGMKTYCREHKEEPGYLCHGDLNQHHILIGNRDISLVEFNKMHLGLQMADLYHFMRKMMEKHNWDLKLGLSMLEAYGQILPLTKSDLACLYYLFLYPEKYWKQINFYYNANKAWIPARNIEKLKDLEAQQEVRSLFLSKIK